MQTIFAIFFVFLLPISSLAQDTIKISYQDFIDKALEYSPLLNSEREKVNRANSKADEIAANKFIPRFDVTSNHGLMPGVSSPSGLPRDEWHLDPNLRNDWNNWSVFTRVEFSMIQPVYTWGALTNAMKAAKSGAEVAAFQNDLKGSDQIAQLSKVYFSLVLAKNLQILANETNSIFDKAESKLIELEDDGDLEEKEVFKFKISKQQFLIKSDEIKFNKSFVEEAFNIALGTKNIVYIPITDTLDTFNGIMPLSLFEQQAIENRVELKAIAAAKKAAEFGLNAQKASRLPGIYFGIGGEYVHTPRPATAQPFIGTRFDYLNLVYSFGIRQSLNFGIMNAKVAQIEYQKKEVEFAQNAVGQAILLEVSNAYKEYLIALSKNEKLSNAFQTSKEWLRKEQIDNDLGIGEIKNLVESMKMNVELDAELKQSVYELTVKKVALLKATGKLN